MPQHIRQYGLNAQGQGQREPSEWEKYMQQAKTAMALDTETALGLAIGKGLRQLWMDHLARRHAREDARNRQNGEVRNGEISDVEAFRKRNGNLPNPTLNVPENWNEAPAETGGMWEKYAVANGVPGSRDYQQESIERVMPTPQLNAGALTTDDLVAALADPYKQKQPFYFGGGF